MARKNIPLTPAQQAEKLARLKKSIASIRGGYRERALKLFPHICARCKCEYSGDKLDKLTVHHKDHNHENNPPDGSNWELLCIYCHDNEHEKFRMEGFYDETARGNEKTTPFQSPFSDLDSMIEPPEEN